MMQFSTMAAVALGGAAGSVLRHIAVTQLGPQAGAAWAVAGVNIIGSFLIGLAFVLLADRGNVAPLVMTGVLGGFTTFSAFSLETLRLIETGRAAEAALYVLCSVVLSLIAVALGTTIARSLT